MRAKRCRTGLPIDAHLVGDSAVTSTLAPTGVN